MHALYVTHPEVVIDPNVPPAQWWLSFIGRSRALAFVARDVVPRGAPIFSSGEPKAIQLAEIISARTGGAVNVRRDLGENDRSSTGYLESGEFELLVGRFFDDPSQGPEGWESAVAAQRRVVAAVTEAIAQSGAQPVVFCGHGAVGTLLKCHVAGRAIAQDEDQRVKGWRGGGNCFVFELNPMRLVSDWVPMEHFQGWPA